MIVHDLMSLFSMVAMTMGPLYELNVKIPEIEGVLPEDLRKAIEAVSLLMDEGLYQI